MFKMHKLIFVLMLSIFYTSSIILGETINQTAKTTITKLEYTKFKTYAYVQTDFVDSQKKYVIEYPEKIISAVVRPYQMNVSTEIKDKEVTFTLPKAGHYVAYINKYKIIIYAETPETLPFGSSVINAAKDLGCNTTGLVNETNKIQSAINDLPSGGTLYFPAGCYLTSQLKICNKAGINIYLARGAEIMADTLQLDSYDLTSVFGHPEKSSIVGRNKWPSARTFILIDNCKQLTIKGYGMVNGQGRAARRHSVNLYNTEEPGRFQNFIISRSQGITLDGIISADPGVWNTHILKSTGVICENVKLMNELDYAPVKGKMNNIDHNSVNTDGFDIDSSSDVVIKNCFGYCADDNIAIKTSQTLGLLDNVDGVTVKNCIFLTQKSSLKVGTETGGDEMKNILFSDNDILEADRAISLYCYDGARMSNIKWENTRVEDYFLDNQKRVVHIEVQPRIPGSKAGCATGIEINDINIRKPFLQKSIVQYSKQNASSISVKTSSKSLQLTISNFVVDNAKMTNLADYFTISGNPTVKLK